MSAARCGALALLLCVALPLGACGEEGGGTTATPPRSEQAARGVPTSRHGDNSIQTWGREAGPALHRRLTALVRAYLEDRAARDWSAVCARLALRQRAEQGVLAGGRGCARAMESFARRADDATLRREARIEILSVRVGPHRGRLDAFVIYRRSDGVWATALAHEAARWRLISVTPQRLS